MLKIVMIAVPSAVESVIVMSIASIVELTVGSHERGAIFD